MALAAPTQNTLSVTGYMIEARFPTSKNKLLLVNVLVVGPGQGVRLRKRTKVFCEQVMDVSTLK